MRFQNVCCDQLSRGCISRLDFRYEFQHPSDVEGLEQNTISTLLKSLGDQTLDAVSGHHYHRDLRPHLLDRRQGFHAVDPGYP